MIGPTASQLTVYRFIQGHWEAQGRAPSYREMALATGRNVSAVFYSCDALRERGWLTRHNQPLAATSLPRAPDGAPLHFVGLAA